MSSHEDVVRSAPEVVSLRDELPREILIVEDDPAIRRLVARSLAAIPSIHECANGAEALERFQDGTFEFVITDLVMPELDGLEMIRRARRTVVGACVPILVLTSLDEESTLLEAFDCGADDFMVKPFSMAELRIRVSSIHLRHRRASDMNPLTQLPGNMVLKREISERLLDDSFIGVAYIDVDNFKGFNDCRGFDRGDHVIKLVADLLRHYARKHPPGEVFVGHLGGDDFVAIVPLDKVEELATEIHSGFEAATAPLFTEEELERGSMRIVGRRGVEEDVPLLSLSIGVVSTRRRGVSDLRQVSHIAAEVKKVAKSTPGNSLFVDRRES